MGVEPDELIINCYRLADRYHQNPDVFLDLPLSKVEQHIRYTIKLIELQQRARTTDDEDG